MNDPDVHYSGRVSGDVLDKTKTHLEKLTSGLTQAFSEGKKIALFRVSNSGHAECAAFDHRGNFVIVAGYSGLHTIKNIKELTKALDLAGIKDSSGHSINFSGKYADTNLQLGGHHCERFAELYCYQIAKEKRLDAYKKVNGAFFDQQLKTFDDLDKIDHARELESLPAPTDKNNWEKTQYEFLLSFICRQYGVIQNKWEEITIKDCKPLFSWEIFIPGKKPKLESLPFYCIEWCCHRGAPLFQWNLKFELNNLQEIDKIYVKETTPFGELLKDKQYSLIINREGKDFLVKSERISRTTLYYHPAFKLD